MTRVSLASDGSISSGSSRQFNNCTWLLTVKTIFHWSLCTEVSMCCSEDTQHMVKLPLRKVEQFFVAVSVVASVVAEVIFLPLWVFLGKDRLLCGSGFMKACRQKKCVRHIVREWGWEAALHTHTATHRIIPTLSARSQSTKVFVHYRHTLWGAIFIYFFLKRWIQSQEAQISTPCWNICLLSNITSYFTSSLSSFWSSSTCRNTFFHPVISGL